MLWDTANPHLHRILVDSNCNWTNGSIWGSHLCVLMMPRRDAYLIWDLVSDTILKDGFHISSNHLVMIHAGVIVGMIVPVSGDVFFCPHRMKRITFRFQSTWCQSCTTQPPESWFIFWSSLIHMILILFRVLFFLMPQINSYAEIYLTFSHISRRGLFVCLIWIYHFLPVVCILCSQIELLFMFLFWLCIMLLHLSFA